MPHLLLDYGHRNAGRERVHHVDLLEDMGSDFLPGELLPGRDLLDPGLLSLPIYGMENGLGASSGPELRPGKSHYGPCCKLSRMECKVSWLTRAALKWWVLVLLL